MTYAPLTPAETPAAILRRDRASMEVSPMDTATHTPGPWKWVTRYSEDGRPAAYLLETEHRPVAWNDPVVMALREDWIDHYVRHDANARLLAASPIMADALVAMVELITSGRHYESQNPYTRPEVKAALAALEAAGITRA